MRLLCLVLLALAIYQTVSAQHHHQSPYAFKDSSSIKSLSRSEINDMKNGAGMGLAKAAELNHFPGPKHVLELSLELGLSEPQIARIESIRLEMLDAAKLVGTNIIAQEDILNRRFLHRHIDESDLKRLTGMIAKLRGDLRFVHLNAHLKTSTVLSSEQIAIYDELRGYLGTQNSG